MLIERRWQEQGLERREEEEEEEAPQPQQNGCPLK